MTLLQSGLAKSLSTDYSLEDSVRYNRPDSPVMYKDVGADADNGLIFTISFWVKLGSELGEYRRLGGCKKVGAYSTNIEFGFMDSDIFEWYFWDDTDTAYGINTVAVYRDCSAWYHFTLRFNAADSTPADRMQIWVNGVRQEAVSRNSGYPPTDKVTGYTSRDFIRSMGASVNVVATPSFQYSFDGYIADFACIDGTLYAASDFGELDEDTNQWIPKDISSLTFGQNGFYLKFEDSANLGNDSSGNNYDWTVTNLAATDQVLDSPTNNFCVMNPLIKQNVVFNLTEGNLECAYGAVEGYPSACFGTIPMITGKWYWEVYNKEINTSGWNQSELGILSVKAQNEYQLGLYGNKSNPGVLWYYSYNGDWYAADGSDSSTHTSYGDTFTDGDIIGIAVNMDDSQITFYKNNVAQNSGTPINFSSMSAPVDIADGAIPFTSVDQYPSDRKLMNFGQDSSFAGNLTAQNNQDSNNKGDFYYEPPTDYLALCTDNLSAPEIALPGENFNTVLYTGTGSNPHAITGVGFQPDFVWTKARVKSGGNGGNPWVTDAVRGVTKELKTDGDEAEGTDLNGVVAFGADGFSVGTGGFNESGDPFVGWCWKANGAGSTNTAGDDDATVSVNTTAGFSIAKFTRTDPANTDTIGHGLGVTPEMMIWKVTDQASDWFVWTPDIGGVTKNLRLNGTNATVTSSDLFPVLPTTTVFTPGNGAGISSGTHDIIAYCFASIEGYSKVGSYTGNGNADGTFVYTGFRPAFIMWKSTTGESWQIRDNKRLGYNDENYVLFPNNNNDRYTTAETDILSNGFKPRVSAGGTNGTDEPFIYYAVAESPFKYANAR